MKYYPLLRTLTALAAVLILVVVWHTTPLEQWLNTATLAGWKEALSSSLWGPPLVLAVYGIGCVVALPITALIAATALVFDPLQGFVYALLGTLMGAATTYAAGYWLGRDTLRRFAGPRVNQLSRELASRGILTMTMVRWLPLVAPYTVVNMAAGASHIRFRDYLLGTLLGMAPIVLAMTVFIDSILIALQNPELEHLAWLAAITTITGLTLVGVRQRLRRRSAVSAGNQD